MEIWWLRQPRLWKRKMNPEEKKSLDQIDFPLNPQKSYSAKELFDVLGNEKVNYGISMARSWGHLRENRTIGKLTDKAINRRLLILFGQSLEDLTLNSLELEFLRKGVEEDCDYEELIDFWYQCSVDNSGRERRYNIVSYAASIRNQEFIENDILRVKKGKSNRGTKYPPKK